MCSRRRQQRGLIAAALLASLHEYQARRSQAQALPPSSSATREMQHSPSFQEPMIQGVTYMAPRYAEPVDPNPPAYEEVASGSPEQPRISLVDEKRQLHRLSTEEQIPPHAHEGYEPNTGLDSVPRSIPAPAITSPYSVTSSSISRHPRHSSTNDKNLTHLLEAITLYFDTQIKLNADRPTKARHLEEKKTRKLAKAEKKYHEYIAKGKDSKNEAKMAKRADKMEKWTEWVLKKSIEHSERISDKGAARHCGCHAGHMESQHRITAV